jgi:predicted outer membrane lipoprotein
MNAWYYFWLANFLIAGSAFAIITAIVLVRGLRDLKEMFANLRAEAERQR